MNKLSGHSLGCGVKMTRENREVPYAGSQSSSSPRRWRRDQKMWGSGIVKLPWFLLWQNLSVIANGLISQHSYEDRRWDRKMQPLWLHVNSRCSLELPGPWVMDNISLTSFSMPCRGPKSANFFPLFSWPLPGSGPCHCNQPYRLTIQTSTTKTKIIRSF